MPGEEARRAGRRAVFSESEEGWGSSIASRVETKAGHRAHAVREARFAVAIAAWLYVVGALLIATTPLLPHVSSASGAAAVAVTAVLTAAGLLIAVARRRAGLTLAFIADLWGIVLIALLCASTGGGSSPFGLIYFLALGHAAAFQPLGRLILVALAALVGFLAPLAYADVSTMFGAVAGVGVVLALLTAGVIYFSLNALREQRRRMEFLIGATAKLDTSLDPAETLRRIASTAVPELAELCVIDLLDDHGSVGTSVVAAVDPVIAQGVERMREAFPLDIHGTHPVAQVLDSRVPYVIHDLTDDGALQRAAQSDEHERFMRDAGYRSAAVFPMIARGRTHGAVSFLHLRSDVSYGREQLALLEDLTGRAALAFDNARLYAERAHVARTLQRSLMPAVLPVIPGLELVSCFRPMGVGNDVGGDFYDAFADEQGSWLVVGDVCGKGAEAAALTGFLRHTTVALAREGRAPAEVLARVNKAMLEQDFEGRFATAILAHLRFVQAGVELTIATAGHPAGLVARQGGEVHELGEHGTLLGVFADPLIEEAQTVLEPGDVLVLYTDGLLEAHAPERIVSVAGMIEQLERTPHRTAKDAIDSLLALVEFDDPVRDDVALLAVRIVPS